MNKLIAKIPYFKKKKEKEEKELQLLEQRQTQRKEWFAYRDQRWRITEFWDWREKNKSESVIDDCLNWEKTLSSNDIIDLLIKYGKYINYSEFKYMTNNPPRPFLVDTLWFEKYTDSEQARYLILYPANYIPNSLMWVLEDRLIRGETNG